MRLAQTCVGGFVWTGETPVTLIISPSSHFKNDLATVCLKCVITHDNKGDPAGINYPSTRAYTLKPIKGSFIHKYMSKVFLERPCAK